MGLAENTFLRVGWKKCVLKFWRKKYFFTILEGKVIFCDFGLEKHFGGFGGNVHFFLFRREKFLAGQFSFPVLTGKMLFSDFGGKMRFSGFGGKILFSVLAEKYIFPVLARKFVFPVLAGKCVFPVLAGKCVFPVLAGKYVFRF